MNSTKNYANLPFRELLEDTAAKSPTPGGGSIAAMAGAMAAALGRMVVNYTLGKPKYAEHQERLEGVLEELRRSGEMFIQLASEDMAAYERYSASRKNADPHEQQRALLTATTVPLEIVAVATTVIRRLDGIKAFLNPYLLSDVRAATLLIDATASAAALNVETNLAQFASGSDASQLRDQLAELLKHCAAAKASLLS